MAPRRCSPPGRDAPDAARARKSAPGRRSRRGSQPRGYSPTASSAMHCSTRAVRYVKRIGSSPSGSLSARASPRSRARAAPRVRRGGRALLLAARRPDPEVLQRDHPHQLIQQPCQRTTIATAQPRIHHAKRTPHQPFRGHQRALAPTRALPAPFIQHPRQIAPESARNTPSPQGHHATPAPHKSAPAPAHHPGTKESPRVHHVPAHAIPKP